MSLPTSRFQGVYTTPQLYNECKRGWASYIENRDIPLRSSYREETMPVELRYLPDLPAQQLRYQATVHFALETPGPDTFRSSDDVYKDFNRHYRPNLGQGTPEPVVALIGGSALYVAEGLAIQAHSLFQSVADNETNVYGMVAARQARDKQALADLLREGHYRSLFSRVPVTGVTQPLVLDSSPSQYMNWRNNTDAA